MPAPEYEEVTYRLIACKENLADEETDLQSDNLTSATDIPTKYFSDVNSYDLRSDNSNTVQESSQVSVAGSDEINRGQQTSLGYVTVHSDHRRSTLLRNFRERNQLDQLQQPFDGTVRLSDQQTLGIPQTSDYKQTLGIPSAPEYITVGGDNHYRSTLLRRSLEQNRVDSPQKDPISTASDKPLCSSDYITLPSDYRRSTFLRSSRDRTRPVRSTFGSEVGSAWRLGEASSAPPTYRLSTGVAFVPLSDRIPSFIREHHSSDFVLMATPKDMSRSKSCERNSRSSVAQSRESESAYFEGGARASVIENEDFEYCSATEPLQGPSRGPPSFYHRNLDAILKKQARPLRKHRKEPPPNES